ncbi:hypothetical protein [Lyngbya sp. CCY1209]|jgi:hypothetical protein|uniref:hypothetical protein n=1 Tax=Lyngbya sp. CCY1209 TaxID=2886103 RepID=UPI002D20C8A9|nr:hypothetical protein [Lyngbya sp. CCY1209]MEB3882919.1 hypothetical protein [Lyngbya sp. CCY1209]
MTFDLSNFTQNLTYATGSSIAQIKADLEDLVAAGREFQIQDKKYQKRQSYGIGVVTFGAIAMFFGGSISPSLALLGVLVLIVGCILLGLNQNRLNEYQKLNFSERGDRHLLLSQLLDFWIKDLVQKSKIKLVLVLSSLTDPQKFVGTKPDPRKPDRSFSFYRDDWLKVKGKFADGTHFFLQITEIYRTCSWRNRNGKSRYREKHKGYRIGLSLHFNPEIYRRVPQRIRRAEAAVKLPPDVALQDVRVTESQIQLKVKLEPQSNPFGCQQLLYPTVVMMFLSAYQILNWVRIGSKRQRA